MSDAEGDPAAVGEIDIAFHELLVQLAASPRLEPNPQNPHHRNPHVHPGPGSHLLRRRGPRRPNTRQIAEAITAGDHLLADDLLVAHMEDAITRLTTR